MLTVLLSHRHSQIRSLPSIAESMVLNSKGRSAGNTAEQFPAYNGRHRPLRLNGKRLDKQRNAHRRSCDIRHARQLTEWTVIDCRRPCLKVSAMRHMVGAVHTRHAILGHHLMVVAQRQHKHRHKHCEQNPRCCPAPQANGHCRVLYSFPHSACKNTLFQPNVPTITRFFTFSSQLLQIKT